MSAIRNVNTTKQMKPCVYSLGCTSKLEQLIANIAAPAVRVDLKTLIKIRKKTNTKYAKKNQYGLRFLKVFQVSTQNISGNLCPFRPVSV